MYTLLNTDSLLYVVVAKTALSFLLLLLAVAALLIGARLFRRGVEMGPDDAHSQGEQDFAVRRLHKDTWLPRGTAVKSAEGDWRFSKLDKDAWLPPGTLIRVPPADEEARRKLQWAGALVMLSSLFWGWLSYYLSPLEVERISAALAITQEHRIQTQLDGLRDDNEALRANLLQIQGKIQTVQDVSVDNARAETVVQGFEQVGDKLERLQNSLEQGQTQLSALQQTVQEEPRFAQLEQRVKLGLASINTDLQTHQERLRNSQREQHTVVLQSLDSLSHAVTGLQPSLLQLNAAQQQLITDHHSDLQTLHTRLNTWQSAQADEQARLQTQLETWQRASASDPRLTALETHTQQLHRVLAEQDQALQALHSDLSTLTANLTDPTSNTSLAAALTTLAAHLSDLDGRVEGLHRQLAAPATPATATDLASLRDEVGQLKTQFQPWSATPTLLAAVQADTSALRTAVTALPAQLEGLMAAAQTAPPPAPAPSTVSEAVAKVVDNLLLQRLTDPNAPSLPHWGAYIDLPLAFTGGATPQLSDTTALQTLAEALQSEALRDRAVLIEGYTDNQGKRQTNQRLSAARAEFVKNYLVTQQGLAANRLTAVGKGAADPIASNATPAGRIENRRVRISVK